MMLLSNLILLTSKIPCDAVYLFKFNNNSIKLSNLCSIKCQTDNFEQANTCWELLNSCLVK